jgi:hypothetical protein
MGVDDQPIECWLIGGWSQPASRIGLGVRWARGQCGHVHSNASCAGSLHGCGHAPPDH